MHRVQPLGFAAMQANPPTERHDPMIPDPLQIATYGWRLARKHGVDGDAAVNVSWTFSPAHDTFEFAVSTDDPRHGHVRLPELVTIIDVFARWIYQTGA